MIEFISQYFSTLGSLFLDLWLWLLTGFFIAGLVCEFVSPATFLKHFKKSNLKTLFVAMFSGMFMSMCSCGAIPIAALIRKRGGSTAIALTFLLAAPWAGFMHLFILSSFVGVNFTLMIFAFSMLTAFISGLAFMFLEKKKILAQPVKIKHDHRDGYVCDICEHETHSKEKLTKRLLVHTPKKMWEVFTDVGKFIIIGLLIAAGLKAFVPVDIITQYLGTDKILSVLISVPIASIIELCSEGFTILAGQLYKMGASLGVVFTMTLVGVTTDFTELSMVFGKFGKKTGLFYTVISLTFAILFGLLINFLV